MHTDVIPGVPNKVCDGIEDTFGKTNRKSEIDRKIDFQMSTYFFRNKKSTENSVVQF